MANGPPRRSESRARRVMKQLRDRSAISPVYKYVLFFANCLFLVSVLVTNLSAVVFRWACWSLFCTHKHLSCDRNLWDREIRCIGLTLANSPITMGKRSGWCFKCILAEKMQWLQFNYVKNIMGCEVEGKLGKNEAWRGWLSILPHLLNVGFSRHKQDTFKRACLILE